MTDEPGDWIKFRELVIADTKSILNLIDTLSGNMKKILILYENSELDDPELTRLLARQNKFVNERLMSLVIENSQSRGLPDDPEVYLMRAFKAQIEIMIMVMINGIRERGGG